MDEHGVSSTDNAHEGELALIANGWRQRHTGRWTHPRLEQRGRCLAVTQTHATLLDAQWQHEPPHLRALRAPEPDSAYCPECRKHPLDCQCPSSIRNPHP